MDYIISVYDGRKLKLYPKECDYCKNIFYVPRYLLSKRKYCSRSCKCSGSCKNKKSEETKECSYCGKTFSTIRTNSKYGFIFCSRECKDNAQSISGGEKFSCMRPLHYGQIDFCLYCGSEIKRSKSKKKYCNSQCSAQHRSDEDFKKWLLNPKSIISGSSRKRLVNILGNFCLECGVGNVWNGKPLILQLHHIDGNNKNNKMENITLLCPNCHTQTETYCNKSRNKK